MLWGFNFWAGILPSNVLLSQFVLNTALYQANNAVKYGQFECALALGFEKMKPGSLGTNFSDRPSPGILMEEYVGDNHGPSSPRMFDNGVQEYFMKHGGGVEHLAMIGRSILHFGNLANCSKKRIVQASKNHRYSVNNPYSQFRDGWSVDQLHQAPKITRNLTKFMCSPTSVSTSILLVRCRQYSVTAFLVLTQDGAACCVVASEMFVHAHGLENQAIEFVSMALCTDGPATFEGRSAMDVVGYEMTMTCADQVFKEAGFAEGQGRDLVGVVELHDCFAANEVCKMYQPDQEN